VLPALQRQAITMREGGGVGRREKKERKKNGATWRTENSSRKSPTLPAPAVWIAEQRAPERKEGAGAIIP
jgi:hypothetical protein